MAFYEHIYLYTDGGSKGNPGPGSIGVVVYDRMNTLLYEFSACIGHCTNNQTGLSRTNKRSRPVC